MQLSNFLRTILKLDAASCLGMAALTLPAAGALQFPLGIGSSLLQAAAAALVPIGLFMLWLGSRREAPAAYVWLVILGNLGWTIASLFAASTIPGRAAATNSSRARLSGPPDTATPRRKPAGTSASRSAAKRSTTSGDG